MNPDILQSLRQMRAAARGIDDHVADFDNELNIREREQLDRESDAIRRAMFELARGVFNDTGIEFQNSRAKLDTHVQALNGKLSQLRRAQEIVDDVRNTVAVVDELLMLAASIRPMVA